MKKSFKAFLLCSALVLGYCAETVPAEATVATSAYTTTLQGNGVTTSFSYNFLIPYQAGTTTPSVVVQVTNTTTGTVTTLPSTAYTISGVGNASGGTVTYAPGGVPLASGNNITITRAVPYTQPTAVLNQSFYPHTVEQIADWLELQIQQLQYEGSIYVGTTAIQGGISGNIEVNNEGLLGEIGTTGSGNAVLASGATLNSPNLITPNLGTPSAINLTNATGLQSSEVITALGFTPASLSGANFTGQVNFPSVPTVNSAAMVIDANGTNCTVGYVGNVTACTISPIVQTITAGSTNTSGFSAGQLLYSDGTHVQPLSPSASLINTALNSPSQYLSIYNAGTQTTSLSLSSQNVDILGLGPQQTIFSNAPMSINNGAGIYEANLKNIGFSTTAASTGTAVTFAGDSTASDLFSRLNLDSVKLSGDSASHGWLYGINASLALFSSVKNSYFFGQVPSGGVWSTNTFGLNLTNDSTNSLSTGNTYVWTETGINVAAHQSGDAAYTEGVRSYFDNFLSGDYGFVANTGGGNYMEVSHVDCDVYKSCVKLGADGSAGGEGFSFISHDLALFSTAHPSYDPIAFIDYGAWGIIDHNNVLFTAGSSTYPDTCVQIGQTSNATTHIVDGNICQGAQIGVHTLPSETNAIITNNYFTDSGISGSTWLNDQGVNSYIHDNVTVVGGVTYYNLGGDKFRPFIEAYPASNINNVTGDGTFYTCVFTTINKQIGTEYSNSTGKITAAVAGVRTGVGRVYLSGLTSAHTSAGLLVQVNGATVAASSLNPYAISNGGFATLSVPFTTHLSVGDIVSLVLIVSNGSKVVGINSSLASSAFEMSLISLD